MDYVTRQFIVLAKKLREDVRVGLTSIRKDFEKLINVVNQQTEQNRSRQERNENPQAPIRVDAITHKPEKESTEENTRHTRSHRIQLAIAVATWLTFFAAAYYGGVARRQWDAMRCANALTQSNYMNDQRAWIGISLPQRGYQIRSDSLTKKPIDFLVAVDTVNTGKTPAFKVHGNIVITVVDKGEKIRVGEYKKTQASYAVDGGVMFPGGEMQLAQPAIRHGEKSAETIIPTPSLLRQLQNGDSVLVVHARIEYLDMQDRPHWITFCRNISSPGLIGPECMDYNNTDKQNLQPLGCPPPIPPK